MLVDDNVDAAPVCAATTLTVAPDAGSTTTCTATHTFKQDELDANGSPTADSGSLTNNVVASSEEVPDAEADLSTPITYDPSINIEKDTNGWDADDPTGPFVIEGDTVTWTYVVVNTGNVTPKDVVVTDSDVAVTVVCDDFGGVLPSGESFTCTVTGIAILGQYENTGTARDSVVHVTDSDDSHYYGLSGNQLSIDITALTASMDMDEDLSVISGGFNITDESEGGSDPDGFEIGLEAYQVDFEWKGTKGTWKQSEANGPGGGSLIVDGQPVVYACTYSLLDIDDDTSVVYDLAPGETIVFDESVNIGYECTFDSELVDGSLRGTAAASIFNRMDKKGGATVFTYSESWLISDL